MVGFIKTVAIIILIYYGFKFLARLLAPFLIKKITDKMGSQFQNQSQQKESTKPEGEVTIEKKQSTKSKFSKNDGEYIDYEEIKD